MTLTEDILALANQGPAGLDEAGRLGLLDAAEKLTLALENPMEKFVRMFFVGLAPSHLHHPILAMLTIPDTL